MVHYCNQIHLRERCLHIVRQESLFKFVVAARHVNVILCVVLHSGSSHMYVLIVHVPKAWPMEEGVS